MSSKRRISLILAIIIILSVFPTDLGNTFAAGEGTNVSEMDALSALGIDSSIPPEGYDANDKSNPYGKDTVTVNPVKELYQFGLSKRTDVLSTNNNETSNAESQTRHIIKDQTI